MSPLERSFADDVERFDPESDRLDEVIVGVTGAARHSETSLASSSIAVRTVLFTECPIRWELTGDWAAGPDGNTDAPASSAPLPPAPSRPEQKDLRAVSWINDTWAEGDKPPF